MIYLEPDTGSVCYPDVLISGFKGKSVNRDKNIAIIDLFEKIRVLIRKKPVNLAGFGRSLFLPHVLCHGRCEMP